MDIEFSGGKWSQAFEQQGVSLLVEETQKGAQLYQALLNSREGKDKDLYVLMSDKGRIAVGWYDTDCMIRELTL